MRKLLAKITLVGFCFLMTSCFGPLPAPNISTYRIEAVNHQQLRSAPNRLILLISMPTTGPAYQSKNMMYSTEPYEIKAFAKNQWIGPPAKMLLPLLITSLNNTHYFHAVVAPPYSGLADLRLNTRLLEFQQQFFGERSQFKMVLQAELIKNSTARVIVERRFTAIISAENTPYGGVVAANRATQQILQQLSRWCVEYALVPILPRPPLLLHRTQYHRPK